MKNYFISCEKANHVCDKSQYKEASFLEKMKLTLHLAYCSACRKYTRNNAKLTAFLNKGQTLILPTEKKQLFKQQIEEHLNHN